MPQAFELAPWRSPLARALHRNRSQPHHRFFQLATVAPDGKPSNRTVVFRGFLEHSNQLKVITDKRSEKITHLQHQSWAEIAWYFTKTREQFRMAGLITIISDSHGNTRHGLERQHTWQNLSVAAQSQFLWPTPAQSRSLNPENFVSLDHAIDHPPTPFTLLLLEPYRVDYLTLRGNPQNRWLYEQDSEHKWSCTEVNP